MEYCVMPMATLLTLVLLVAVVVAVLAQVANWPVNHDAAARLGLGSSENTDDAVLARSALPERLPKTTDCHQDGSETRGNVMAIDREREPPRDERRPRNEAPAHTLGHRFGFTSLRCGTD